MPESEMCPTDADSLRDHMKRWAADILSKTDAWFNPVSYEF
jgi:hypothetical protein